MPLPTSWYSNSFRSRVVVASGGLCMHLYFGAVYKYRMQHLLNQTSPLCSSHSNPQKSTKELQNLQPPNPTQQGKALPLPTLNPPRGGAPLHTSLIGFPKTATPPLAASASPPKRNGQSRPPLLFPVGSGQTGRTGALEPLAAAVVGGLARAAFGLGEPSRRGRRARYGWRNCDALCRFGCVREEQQWMAANRWQRDGRAVMTSSLTEMWKMLLGVVADVEFICLLSFSTLILLSRNKWLDWTRQHAH
ncbi:hypothetical protein HDK64DRAFT_137096 [Phyllosticta capitalensis]